MALTHKRELSVGIALLKITVMISSLMHMIYFLLKQFDKVKEDPSEFYPTVYKQNNTVN
jgi:hypothetical protein